MTSGVSSRNRGGFTLIETIVTVGLLAVLAAFVIPTVIQKAGAGDPVKVASDVTAIRTALEMSFIRALILTIVTVGLLAVLAAFVIPTVIHKAVAGDPVKVASDVTAIRTALETFQSDVRGGYPNQIRLLTDLPTTQNHFIDSTTAFTPGQIAVWNGPYLAAAMTTVVTDSLATGYTAYIKN